MVDFYHEANAGIGLADLSGDHPGQRQQAKFQDLVRTPETG